MEYSTYIFDFDYTLADATNGIVASVNHALTQMNFIASDRDDIRKTVGMPLAETFTHLTGINDAEQKDRFKELFKEKADDIMLDNTDLFPDTIKVLSHLKSKGIKTGIVTTKLRYRIEQVLNKFDINHLIDSIVGFEDVINAKPHPEGLLAAIRKLDAHPDKVLYIGDSMIDAKTAYSARVDFVAVTTGTTGKEEFMQLPNIAVFSSLSALLSD